MTARSSSREMRPGVAAAELAIALPFLTLLFAVAVDFCRVYHYTQTLQNCAYAGALYASNYAQPAPASSGSLSRNQALTNAAQQAALAESATLNPPLTASDVQVAFANGEATVTVTYTCSMLTPVLGPARSIVLTRQMSMIQMP